MLCRQRLNECCCFRDRENSTVFVADLPEGVTEQDLQILFKDVRVILRQGFGSKFLIQMQCGEIREIKVTRLPAALVATVEFFSRVSPVVILLW